MALTGKTISQLPELTAITSNAEFVVEQSGATYKIKNSLFNNTYLPLSGGSVTGLTVNGELTVTGNTSLKGLTATTVSASTYTNVPVVTGGTYTSGTITFNNATGGTFNVTGLPVGGQGGQLYYFNTSVTQTPYKEFGPTGTTASEQVTTISVASGITSTIESYLTPSGYPNSLILPGGVWSFYLHSYKEDSSSSFDLYCDVYKRTSGGTETYLFSTDPFDVTSTASTPTMGITDAYFSGTPLTISDRILVLVRATNTGVSTKNITFVSEGLFHYSYGITTFNGIPANVSSLTTGTGLSGNSTTGAVTLVNTAPDQTVTISGGSNIQIAGTYPNFGVNYTGQTSFPYLPLSGGTVTGNTIFQSGLTATTISATTYENVPSFVNLSFGHSSVGPADATTYYIGGLLTLTPSTTNRDAWSLISQHTGTITNVSVTSNFGGGSSENSTLTLHNLTSGTSQNVTSSLQYVSGTPVQILFEALSASTIPVGWSSVQVVFNGPATSYAAFTALTSTLTSPVFDGTAYASINVQTDVARFGAALAAPPTDGPILVEYSLNSGSTWTSAGVTSTPTSTTYLTSTVSVPATSSQMAIRFSVSPLGNYGKRLRNVYFNGLSSSINNNYTLGTPLVVTNGDKLQLRWLTPTWATNPSGVTNLFNLKLRL